MLATGNEKYKRMAPDRLDPLRARLQPTAEASFGGVLSFQRRC